eukprot:746552-Hanusia_phi.AAC.3
MVVTTNAKLQEKLDSLVEIMETEDIEKFVRAFVPLDLSEEEISDYLARLKEDKSEWENIKIEIKTIAEGDSVTKIEGDQVRSAVFFFQHPSFDQVDREVEFVFEQSEWRAQG